MMARWNCGLLPASLIMIDLSLESGRDAIEDRRIVSDARGRHDSSSESDDGQLEGYSVGAESES